MYLNTQRKSLPSYGAVYLVSEEEKLLYIGATNNLRHRWIDHQLLRQLQPTMNRNFTGVSHAAESEIYRIQVVVNDVERRLLQETARQAGKSLSNLIRELFHLPPRANAGKESEA